jgi:predicted  nucleic acid-binding Zn-ribbon protein
VTMLVGFLTMWLKLRYGAEKAEEAAVKATAVEKKIDDNTVISIDAKNAAQQAEKQTNGAMSRFDHQVKDHQARIVALEMQLTALRTSVESVVKSVDSTRHELRGHLQAVVNKLDLMAARKPTEP